MCRLINESNRYHRTDAPDKTIIIIGIPNVGKSTIINQLRQVRLLKSNFSMSGWYAWIINTFIYIYIYINIFTYEFSLKWSKRQPLAVEFLFGGLGNGQGVIFATRRINAPIPGSNPQSLFQSQSWILYTFSVFNIVCSSRDRHMNMGGKPAAVGPNPGVTR